MTPKRLRAALGSGPRGARVTAAGIGILRTGLGAALLARPEAMPRTLGVDRVSARRMSWAVRMFGARDAALGLLGAHAALTGRPLRPSLLAQAASDGADVVVLALAVRQRQVSAPRALAVAAFAVSGVVGLLATARDADGPARH